MLHTNTRVFGLATNGGYQLIGAKRVSAIPLQIF